jgi:hypothetical protein
VLSVTNSKKSIGKVIVGTENKQSWSVIVIYWYFVVLSVTESKTSKSYVKKYSGAFFVTTGALQIISITYSECVLVSLVVQHAMRMHHTVISGLPHSTILFHIILLTRAGLLSRYSEWLRVYCLGI